MRAELTPAVLLLCVFVGSCAGFRQAQAPVTGVPAVRELSTLLPRLQAADAASASLLLTEIGRVGYSGWEAPQWRLAYRPFTPQAKRVLILAGIRGTDAAGVDYALGLVAALADRPDAAPGWNMDIVPIVNPWGWAHDTAGNIYGIDVGLDFASFDSSEARILRRFLREKRYDLAIELRENPSAKGFSIAQYGVETRTASEQITRRVQAEGFAIETRTELALFQPRQGIVEVPMWGLKVLQATRRLPAAGYLRRNVSSTVYAVETPASLPLADRVAMQRTAVEALLEAHGSDN